MTDPAVLLAEHFGPGPAPQTVTVPGRVNLIGEHIDYHNLPVLPMALPRSVQVAFRPARQAGVRAVGGDGYGPREFMLAPPIAPGPPGDWENYLKAAAQAAQTRWRLPHGIEAAVVSDLPPAAGLSSSSALLTAFTLALLRANRIGATFEELMDILPEGEHFVGTRGGGMDHAAVLAARPGCALLVGFAPVSAEPVPIPTGWEFLAAHSLVTAEKSGAVRAEYNSRRVAGAAALERLGYPSFAAALKDGTPQQLGGRLSGEEQRCFLHVAGEAVRVREAVAALRAGDPHAFGRLLDESHASARDLLRISCPALDRLVEAARAAGALGARLTGAGFGGCAVMLCRPGERAQVRARLARDHYAAHPEFNSATHLIDADPCAGALFV
jgi:galactokinase